MTERDNKRGDPTECIAAIINRNFFAEIHSAPQPWMHRAANEIVMDFLAKIAKPAQGGERIEYDPAYLRRNGWVYDPNGFWITEQGAPVACYGWLSATLEQRRRDAATALKNKKEN